jgi:thiol-disulfide isomerase/thioredoxin
MTIILQRVLLLITVFSGVAIKNKATAQNDLVINFRNELVHLMTPPLNGVVFTYELVNDTIHYLGKPYRIKLPEKVDVSETAFSFLGFHHNTNHGIPNQVAFLIHPFHSQEPRLYIDLNYNLDFSDDGPPLTLSPDHPSEVTLTQPGSTEHSSQLILKRLLIQDKKHEDRLQSFANPNIPPSLNNTTLPARYWITETRKNYKANEPGLSTAIALQDWNNNGRFDDAGIDKILIADSIGTEINDRKQIYRYTIGTDTTLQYNGVTFVITEVDPAGRFVKLKKSTDQQHTANQIILKPGMTMPNFTFDLFSGTQSHWNDVRPAGKYVLLDFWGTWCKPCLEQTDQLKSMYEAFADKLEIIGLAHQDNRGKAVEYVSGKKLTWIQGFADDKVVAQFSILNFPYYILVNPKNRIIGVNMRLDEIEREMSK